MLLIFAEFKRKIHMHSSLHNYQYNQSKKANRDYVILPLSVLNPLFRPVYVCVCAPSSQVLICVHDERTGGELHGASELGKPETQALHLRHAWSGVSVWR